MSILLIFIYKRFVKNAKANTLNPELKSKLIETVIQNHLSRLAYCFNPSDFFDPKEHVFYYKDKNKKEVDFVLKEEEELYPSESLLFISTKSASNKNFLTGFLIIPP